MNSSYVTGFNTGTPITESPNFYQNQAIVGSSFTGAYSLTANWQNNLNTPFVYIDFYEAGPIPIKEFCSNGDIWLQCRVYTTRKNILVAQLKSTAVNSFTLTNGVISLLYPASKISITSQYKIRIKIFEAGTTKYVQESSRSSADSSLSPITTSSIFSAYADKYGSNRGRYETNMFLSFNPSGQFFYNNLVTGSFLNIVHSGLSQRTHCEIWVQN